MKPYSKWTPLEKLSWRAVVRWAKSGRNGLRELERSKAHPLISVALMQVYRQGFEVGYKAKRS